MSTMPVHRFPTQAEMSRISRRDPDPATIIWLGDNESEAMGCVIVVKGNQAARMADAFIQAHGLSKGAHVPGGIYPMNNELEDPAQLPALQDRVEEAHEWCDDLSEGIADDMSILLGDLLSEVERLTESVSELQKENANLKAKGGA